MKVPDKIYLHALSNEFISTYPSHKSAKAALHRKCEEMKNAPYECDGEYYTIKPYNHD